MQQIKIKKKNQGDMIRFVFQGDSRSGIYDYLNHAVHNLLQFQHNSLSWRRESRRRPSIVFSAVIHTVLIFKVLCKAAVLSSQQGSGSLIPGEESVAVSTQHRLRNSEATCSPQIFLSMFQQGNIVSKFLYFTPESYKNRLTIAA